MTEERTTINRSEVAVDYLNREQNAPDMAAVMTVTKKPLIQETDWFEINGIVVKYRRLPAYAYNRARTNLRQMMRQNKPKPPILERGARKMVNKNDPYYKDQISQWQEEWETLEKESFLSTSLLAGLKLKDPVPPKDEWLPIIIDMLNDLDIDTNVDKLFSSFGYNPEKMKELYFKQYIVMADHKDMENFSNYQTAGSIETNEDDITAQAVDMF